MANNECISLTSSDEDNKDKNKNPTFVYKSVEDIKLNLFCSNNQKNEVKKRITPIHLNTVPSTSTASKIKPGVQSDSRFLQKAVLSCSSNLVQRPHSPVSSTSFACDPQPIILSSFSLAQNNTSPGLHFSIEPKEKLEALLSHSSNSVLQCSSPVPFTPTSCSRLFEKYIVMCKKYEQSAEMDLIIQKLFKTYYETSSGFRESKEFENLLNDQFEVACNPSFNIFVSIKNVKDEMKFNKKRNNKKRTVNNVPAPQNTSASINTGITGDDGNPAGENENERIEEIQNDYDSDEDSLYGFDEDRKKKIRKLEKSLRALKKAITILETREVKWDKEEDSSYIMMDRYQKRFAKVYEKVCQLRNKAADADRAIKRKVSFSGSGYPDIDKYVEKMYNRTKKFPDFHDVYEIVKEVKKKENLSSDQLYKIAEKIFKEFGKLLKLCRQRDDYDIMCSYLPNAIDPALNNSELDKKLSENYEFFKKKEKEVIDSFVEKEVSSGVKAEIVDLGDEEDVEVEKEEVEEEDEDDDMTADEVEEEDSSDEEDNNNGCSGDEKCSQASEENISNKKRKQTMFKSNSDDLSNSDSSKKKFRICSPVPEKSLVGENKINKTDNTVDKIHDESLDKIKDWKRKTCIATSEDLFSCSSSNIELSDKKDFTNDTICFHNKKNLPDTSSIEVKLKNQEIVKQTFVNLLGKVSNIGKGFEVESNDGKTLKVPGYSETEISILSNPMITNSDGFDKKSKKKENLSKIGGGDGFFDDDCVIEDVKIVKPIVLNPKDNNYDSSKDIDVVFAGKSDDDEVRIITPGKKIKRSLSSMDDSDVSVIQIENKITFSYQPKFSDVTPLATTSTPTKLPVVVKKTETNFVRPVSKAANKRMKTDELIPQSKQQFSDCTQTARVLYDGKRAKYVSKNSAQKVLSLGNTKVFTKGVKSGKFVYSDEIITVD